MRQDSEVAAMVGFGLSDTGNHWDVNGNPFRSGCGASYTVPMAVEYGKSYYHTLFATTSFSHYSCGFGTRSGFNDVEAGVRGRWDYFSNDHTWEVALIVPSYVDPNGPAQTPKNLGVRLGINSGQRFDTYEGFSSGEMLSKDAFAYGVGVKGWTGPMPHEVYGHLAWGHILSEAAWDKDFGGWNFTLRLDGAATFAKIQTQAAVRGPLAAGVIDYQDRWWYTTGTAAVYHNLTRLSGIQLSLTSGIAGRNHVNPLGVHINYNQAWRN
jgi:hypothetical protein